MKGRGVKYHVHMCMCMCLCCYYSFQHRTYSNLRVHNAAFSLEVALLDYHPLCMKADAVSNSLDSAAVEQSVAF